MRCVVSAESRREKVDIQGGDVVRWSLMGLRSLLFCFDSMTWVYFF